MTLILALACILAQQETQYLLWTGGITGVTTLRWTLYLRPPQDFRWLVIVAEAEDVPTP
ncbi:hypothetical protein [Amycolatopsis sp. H20-H5]|uniref:hypothetical protein n=1 Tax=Amycolatopsis sp. H20-H5 TaxID=3046309 RepID=UPI002DBF72EB|nr:hypothetical protein [Amycolatopsis sp. H20-H5]MEC3979621.1 hypothetical protein [Amycolatopsis sp. H20-H5]